MTDDVTAARERMVERLQRSGYVSRASTLEALRTVPREQFIPEHNRENAYRDRPQPIGDGQTISAPHMVGKMVDLLELETGDRVLEIGTGCGYHAAVVAEVVGAENVYSVEVSPHLAEETRERLDDLGYGDISIRVGDGREGWAAHSPFDASYLTCAVPEIPTPILEQVRHDGYVVAPIGTSVQKLVRVTVRNGSIAAREHHGGVRFVTMREGPTRG